MRGRGLVAKTRRVMALTALICLAASRTNLTAAGGRQGEPKSAQGKPNGAPHLTLILKPDSPRADHDIPAVDVWLTIGADHVAAANAALTLPLVVDNVRTSAPDIEILTANDAHGPVPLVARDDSDGKNQRR